MRMDCWAPSVPRVSSSPLVSLRSVCSVTVPPSDDARDPEGYQDHDGRDHDDRDERGGAEAALFGGGLPARAVVVAVELLGAQLRSADRHTHCSLRSRADTAVERPAVDLRLARFLVVHRPCLRGHRPPGGGLTACDARLAGRSRGRPFLAPQYTRERPQAVRVPVGLAVGADAEEGHDVAFFEGRHRVVLGEDVGAFVDVAGERVGGRARRVGRPTEYRLDELLVDEGQVHDVPAAGEAGEDGAAVAGLTCGWNVMHLAFVY